MTFQYPQALYLFLLIPLLIIFYFIKTKKVEHYYTPAYFLWVRVAEQSRSKSVMQQLLRNLTLLFQVLIVIGLVVALAKPRLVGELDLEQPVVLIVDNSAGMSTKEGDMTRLKQAKAQALKLIDDLGQRQIMPAATVMGDESLPAFTDNRAQLIKYINRIPATDGMDDLAQLIPYLLVRSQAPPQIYVISDAASSGIERLLDSYESLKLIKVGQATDNLAIVELEVRRNPFVRSNYQVMVRVVSYGGKPGRVKLVTSLNENVLDAREVDLPANEPVTVIIDGKGDEGGILKSRLLVDDVLSVDNQAYAVLKPRRDITLLMVNVKHKHLQRALGVLDRVRIISMSKAEYLQLAATRPYTRFDIGVFYGFNPETYQAWHNLIINPEPGVKVPVNAAFSWDRSHPLMKYLELSPVRVSRANLLKVDPQSRVLWQAGGIPLLVYDSRQRSNVLRLGFALEDSDFHLRPAFPMFLLNMLNFFSAQTISRNLVKLELGQPYLIPILSGQLKQDVTGHIITPGGDRLPVKLHKAEENYYRPLMAGEYRFVLNNFTSEFIVNPAAAESKIAPHKVSSSRVISVKSWRVWGGYIKFWHIWALLALGVVVFEWWYHREKVDALY